MDKPSSPSPQPMHESESIGVYTWRDLVFWTLLVSGIVLVGVLAVIDDPLALGPLVRETTHDEAGDSADPVHLGVVVETVRWWALSLPLLALVFRWAFPLRPRKDGLGRMPAVSGADGSSRGECVPRSGASLLLRIPPVAVGLFALQIVLGAAYLTGAWSYIRERYWFPEPSTADEIRAAFLPRGLGAATRRLSEVLPPDAEVYVLPEPGQTPVFINFFLYPRRFYTSEDPSVIPENASSPEFWTSRRSEGFRWIYLYNPRSDPVGGGHLIELPPVAGREEAGGLGATKASGNSGKPGVDAP